MSLTNVIINVIGPEIMLKREIALAGSSLTFGDLIRILLNQHEGPWERILENDQSLKKGCVALVNGRNIKSLDGCATRIHEGDEITFTVLITGG